MEKWHVEGPGKPARLRAVSRSDSLTGKIAVPGLSGTTPEPAVEQSGQMGEPLRPNVRSLQV